MKLHLYILLCFIILFTSCKRNFQYSVLEVKPIAKDLNARAIAEIQQRQLSDSLHFLIISDTQVSYDELQDFVSYSNSKYASNEIDFILHAGDITDYGANFEYNLYYDEVKKSKFPIIATIGNHDMLGNGRTIYQKMFGEENFDFEVGNYRFIGLNTNGREVNFNQELPNIDWLHNQLILNSDKNIIYLSHVSPFSSDFDPHLSEIFQHMIESTPYALLSIHGHSHSFSLEKSENNNFQYLVAPTINKRQYVEVKIAGDKTEIKQKFF
ncbi:MAG: metallophosphoesterase family protein [Sphingobacterium composti]|uniref:metallophosphoesterase family protein n=1 Tax=Sphingobacterium composti TaxID=363260 RepID=UPI0013592632|nr:metallophosphoesterase [Sphingobacterium composti Ten et al. 2007 non Yoo et al. 2007]